MNTVHLGNRVTVSYIGTLDNGRVFADTTSEGPLTFTVGGGEIFPALESAVIGMRAGEVKNITLVAAEAYGPRREENVLRLARQTFPADKEIVVGQKLSIEFRRGSSRVMLVTAVDERMVTLDGNHPLAGRELTFALRVDRVE